MVLSQMVMSSLWGPVLSSHPVLGEYSVEVLHYTYALHRDKGVAVGVLPGGGGVGWKGVPSREVRGTPVACVGGRR